eukprot:GHVT01082434.1.p1 GENE.GHVT01082434.1~~GHVT01082434.1.p1  ORF type:complete len:156 (+),score=25.87 GHVT01082434.1:28-468(+)
MGGPSCKGVIVFLESPGCLGRWPSPRPSWAPVRLRAWCSSLPGLAVGGFQTLRGAGAIGLMLVGYRLGLIKFVALAGRRETRMEEAAGTVRRLLSFRPNVDQRSEGKLLERDERLAAIRRAEAETLETPSPRADRQQRDGGQLVQT